MSNKRNYEPKPLFIERMHQLLPNESDFHAYLKKIKEEPQASIRCNTLKITPEKLAQRFKEKGWKFTQPFKDYPEIMIIGGKTIGNQNNPNSTNNSDKVNNTEACNLGEQLHPGQINYANNQMGLQADGKSSVIALAPGELGRALEHLLGYYYIQEISSMLPILALQPKPEDMLLDIAAAPGSKTTQAAAMMQNRGLIIANDISIGRIKILAANANRCGVSNLIITKKDGITLCKKFENENFLFDKILIDAPCSGEGTIRSKPATLEMWNIKTINNLSKLQKALVANAINILKPGGEIVYSTCTHAPEENEAVVDFVINNFKDVEVEQIKLPIKCRSGIALWINNNYSQEVKKSCRIYPQDNNTEGFFIAKFRKA